MYEIVTLSYTALALLRISGRGQVHSVYNKTVNLSFGQSLLALQSRGSVSSPLTLETSCSPAELQALRLRPGMPAEFLSDELYVNDFRFGLLNAQYWDAHLPSSLPAAPSHSLSFLLDCLRQCLPRGGFSDLMLPDGTDWTSSPYALEASKILATARLSLRAGNWSQAAVQLCSLIGLGEGLTPSGDDFLCGVLAGCHLSDSPPAATLSRELRTLLPTFLKATNSISAGFLRCAADGLFSRPTIALAQGTSLSAAQEAFSSIGHSSGIDTLSGIIFLLSCL